MEAAKLIALQACGNCGQPESAHKHKTGTDEEALDIFAALGGACQQYVVSDAAVIYQKHLAIADNRQPGRRPDGSLGKRNPLCTRCGHRHPGKCVL